MSALSSSTGHMLAACAKNKTNCNREQQLQSQGSHDNADCNAHLACQATPCKIYWMIDQQVIIRPALGTCLPSIIRRVPPMTVLAPSLHLWSRVKGATTSGLVAV